jgi:hypothetical protein
MKFHLFYLFCSILSILSYSIPNCNPSYSCSIPNPIPIPSYPIIVFPILYPSYLILSYLFLSYLIISYLDVSIYLSIYLSTYLSIYLSGDRSINLSLYRSISLSLYLSVSLIYLCELSRGIDTWYERSYDTIGHRKQKLFTMTFRSILIS